MEMANRDVLSRAIFNERRGGRGIFLDCRPIARDDLAGRLHALVELTRGLTGIDPGEQPIPVVPAFHYQMGGIATDVEGRTSVAGLLAAGECACVSVHGGNRIGANSLLETLVMGRAAGESAAKDARDGDGDASSAAVGDRVARERSRIDALRARPGSGVEVAALHDRLGRLMADRVGIERMDGDLRGAIAELEDLSGEVSEASIGDSSRSWNQALRRRIELENLIVLGRVVAASALARRESRGAHYRADHPASGDVARHTLARLERGGRIAVDPEAVRDASGGAS
jgi:succinate dehydrogenase/fumarate reductase flavoprotein subunit